MVLQLCNRCTANKGVDLRPQRPGLVSLSPPSAAPRMNVSHMYTVVHLKQDTSRSTCVIIIIPVIKYDSGRLTV